MEDGEWRLEPEGAAELPEIIIGSGAVEGVDLDGESRHERVEAKFSRRRREMLNEGEEIRSPKRKVHLFSSIGLSCYSARLCDCLFRLVCPANPDPGTCSFGQTVHNFGKVPDNVRNNSVHVAPGGAENTRWDSHRRQLCLRKNYRQFLGWWFSEVNGTIPAETNSNDFGFLELISRFEFEFRRRENFSRTIRIFGVFKVQSHTMWPYMCVCCGLFVPTQFQFECCDVRDDS